MRAKFATWYLVTLVIGYFCAALSKSINIHRDNFTASSDQTRETGTSESYYSTVTAISSKVSSLPNYLTRFTLDQISDKKRHWRLKAAKPDKALVTNKTTMENVKDKFQSKLSTRGDYIFGSLILIACIPALLGNGCALSIILFRQRRLIPMEVFFINLSTADILLSVASYPMSIIASFKHRWNFRELGCTIYAFCCYFLSLSSIYIITAMAITRYLITCKPARGNQINCWTCWKMVAVSYLLAFFWAAMPLFGFGNYEVEPFGLSCTLDWIAKDKASRIYFGFVTIFCVFVPMFILIFCYSQIIMLVTKSTAMMKSSGHTKQRKNGSSVQLTQISGLISTGFVVAWFPYTIACLWTSFKGKVILPIWLTPGPALFAKLSIVYNPIIYVFLIPRYQKDFYDLIRYISCKYGVREIERTQKVDLIIATGDGTSKFRRGESNSNTNGMEDDTVETSNSYGSVTVKETCV